MTHPGGRQPPAAAAHRPCRHETGGVRKAAPRRPRSHSRPVEDARPASTDQPPSLRRPSRDSRRSCGTTSTQRPRQILVPAAWICGGPAGAIPAGYPATGSPLSPCNGSERGNILAEYFRFAVGDRDGSGSRIDGERRVGFPGITVGTNEGHKLVSSLA
jgi:hypothetical protein